VCSAGGRDNDVTFSWHTRVARQSCEIVKVIKQASSAASCVMTSPEQLRESLLSAGGQKLPARTKVGIC